MIRFEPTGRGAEPQVSTTVASATPRPALRQSSAALRISSSRVSVLMGASQIKSVSILLYLGAACSSVWCSYNVRAPSPRAPSGRLRPSTTGDGEGRDEGALPQ